LQADRGPEVPRLQEGQGLGAGTAGTPARRPPARSPPTRATEPRRATTGPRRPPAGSRRTGATEPWWATTGPEPAVRRATTDCQVDRQECGQPGRFGRGRAVAWGARDGGAGWGGRSGVAARP